MAKAQLLILMIALTVVLIGCEEDERLARMAHESTQRQAEQNEAMAEVSRESVQASGRLVEAEARARQELLTMQRELQEQQVEIARQHDRLEEERRQLASQRRWDSLTAAAITNTGLVLACLAPLVVCWYLLRAVRDETEDAVVAEVLVEELASDRPRLLPPFSDDRTSLPCNRAPRPSLAATVGSDVEEGPDR
jgi:hypothetical protein